MASKKHTRHNAAALGGKKNKHKKITLRRAQGKKPAGSRKILIKKKVAKKVRRKVLAKNRKIKKVSFLPRGKKLTKLKFKEKKEKKIKIIKPKNKKVILKHKVFHETENSASSEGPLFKAKIRVIGIGGGGGSIVSEIGRTLGKATFVIADTDIRALKKGSGVKYFWFGENLTRGLGTGANPELAKKAAEESKEKLKSIFEGQDIIIFIASLGGGLGSGATQVFAEVAKEFGGITFGIFTLPFKFEGKNKNKIALNALKSIRPFLNVSLTIPNEKIFKIIDANTPITQAFSVINKSLTGSLESLIDLIYNPGVINIDFADLKTILKGRGNLAFLNTIEESGKDRAEKICEKVLSNPLLLNNNFEAEKILFNIAGSENLSMFEVEKVSRRISEAHPKAKIIFGISKNSKLKGKIKTTILMTGGGLAPVRAVAEPVIALAQELKEPKTKEKPDKSPKPQKNKKPPQKKQDKKEEVKDKNVKEEVLIPVFQAPIPVAVSPMEKRLNIIDMAAESSKKGIRRSGLEIKKAEDLEEKKRLQQEKEWEIPAFLRRVKYKN